MRTTPTPEPVPRQSDRRVVEDLAMQILIPVRDSLAAQHSRARNFEVLNALAIVASFVLQGCDGLHGSARKFFDDSIEANNLTDERRPHAHP